MNDETFIVNRLRAKPVTYSVEISHIAVGGQWQIASSVHGVGEDQINRERVAADLRHVASMMDGMPATQKEVMANIASEILRAIERFQPDIDLQAILGSYGDTLPDEEVLGLLRSYNAGSGLFESVYASTDPQEMRAQIKIVEDADAE